MYSKMAKKELEQECGKRGIVYGGLDKKELVKRLKEHDEVEGSEYEEVENDGEGSDGEESDDEENVEEGKNEDGGNGAEVNDGKIKLLLLEAEQRRFQMEKEKVREEKERAMAERDRVMMEKEKIELEMAMLSQKASLGLIQLNSTVSGDDVTVTHSAVKLPTMLENEEILQYFHAFERTATLNGVNEQRWARMLPSLLNSKMRAHYNRLSIDVCTDYKRVKLALLNSCQITSKNYMDKFCSARRTGKQSYAQFLDELNDLYRYYLESREITTFEQLKDDVIMQRLRASLPPDTRYFCSARGPKSSQDLAKHADLHFLCTTEARQEYGDTKQGGKPKEVKHIKLGKQQWRRNPFTREEEQEEEERNGQTHARPMHTMSSSTNPNGGANTNSKKYGKPNMQNQRPYKANFVKTTAGRDKTDEYGDKFIVPLFLSGKPISCVRDSGASITIIDSSLVRDNTSARAEDQILVECAFGIKKYLPTCVVEIASPQFETDEVVKITVRVVPNLRVNLLLGNDVFEKNKNLKDPIQTCRKQTETPTTTQTQSDSNMQTAYLTTRRHNYDRKEQAHTPTLTQTAKTQTTTGTKNAHDKRDKQTDKRRSSKGRRLAKEPEGAMALITDHYETGRLDRNPETPPDHADNVLAELMAINGENLNDDHKEGTAEGATVKEIRQSTGDSETGDENDNDNDSELWRDNRGPVKPPINNDQTENGCVNDETLQEYWGKARQGEGNYVIENGFLYRTGRHNKNNEENSVGLSKVLMLPVKYRQKVLEIGHDSLWSGHRGMHATTARVGKAFSWPTMTSDIHAYVRSCPECQKTAVVKTSERAPLVEVPIISKVFDTLVTDVLGPITPKSSSGKQYILIIVEQVTHWPEFIPLSNVTAKCVAKAFVDVFSRTGIPRVIKSDNDTHFKNQLIRGLEDMLVIAPAFSTVDHHETAGSAERMIRVVREMLRKVIEDDPRSWEHALPFLAFSCRQIPSIFPGFPPFEFLYAP